MSKRSISLLLVFLLLLMSFEARATVLYVRFSNTEIVIGADSKRTAETGATVWVCMITRINDVFVASAGLAEYGDFDPREIAKDALADTHDLVEARDRLQQLIESPLLNVLTKIKNRNPDRYAAFKQGAAVNMIFARFNDIPELVGTALTPRDT